MTGVEKLIRLLMLGGMAMVVFSACGIGSSGDDGPTQTPIVVTSTPTPDEAEGRATSAQDPTATTEPTATPTIEPTTRPSPTPRPTVAALPTPTRVPVVLPTPTPTQLPAVELPQDLLSVLPTVEDVPPGMIVVEEGEANIGLVAADFDDAGAREQQLLDWGFTAAVFREFELPPDQIVEQNSQPIGMIFQMMLLGSAEASPLEMDSFIDGAVLGEPDVNAQEIAIDPIGDHSRAVIATTESPELGEINVAVIAFTAGRFSMHYIAAGGALYDPVPDLITAANATLNYLGYSAFPAFGDVLLETDFSNWTVGELESGALAIDEDGNYHIRVDQGSGAFIAGYSTDHEPFGDVAVSVDMRYIGGDPSSQGCIMTRVDQVEQTFDYALCVDGNGNVEALYEQFDAERNYASEPLLPAGVVTVAPPVDWTTLSIVARGEEFWFAINDEIIDSVRHVGPPAGSVGVLVNHFVAEPQLPAEFLFSNLIVQAVE